MGTTTHTHPQHSPTHQKVWVYWQDDFAVIRVPLDGKEVIMQDTRQHDEGFSHVAVSYHIEQGYLWRDVFRDASDCDGPIQNWQTAICPLHLIPPASQQECPEFTRVSSAQRDHFAEAAGY